jgi:cellulose synthase operon protein C
VKTALLEKRQGRADAAIARLRRVLRRDPAMTEAHTLLGSSLLEAGQSAAAAAAFKAALALDSEHRGATFNLALAYKHMGRLDATEAGFERGRALDPRDGKPRWQLADIWMQRGQLDRAHRLLVDSLQLPVDQAAFLLKLAECLIEMKQLDEAKTRVHAALALRPRLPRAHYDLALIHEAVGDQTAAEQAYAQELELNPSTWQAAYNLGQLLLRGGRAAEAARQFEAVVATNAAFSGGYLYLAKARFDAGDLAAAKRAADQGLARSPAPALEVFGRYLLADVYSRTGRADASEREADAARRLEAEMRSR